MDGITEHERAITDATAKLADALVGAESSFPQYHAAFVTVSGACRLARMYLGPVAMRPSLAPGSEEDHLGAVADMLNWCVDRLARIDASHGHPDELAQLRSARTALAEVLRGS